MQQTYQGFSAFKDIACTRRLPAGTTIVAGGQEFTVLGTDRGDKHAVYRLGCKGNRVGDFPLNARKVLQGCEWYIKD